MTSRCLDKRKYDTPSGECTGATDRPAGGDTGHLFLMFGGPVCADRISYCPLDRVLTYKNLIYLLNLQIIIIIIIQHVLPRYEVSFWSHKDEVITWRGV